MLFAGLLDADVDQIADDGIHVATDIADLGKFGGLDFDEGRIRQSCQAARDLGLADPGRPDHQNIFRCDLVPQRLGNQLAAPAVTQGDCYGAFGVVLADHVLVEFGNDVLRSQVHGG